MTDETDSEEYQYLDDSEDAADDFESDAMLQISRRMHAQQDGEREFRYEIVEAMNRGDWSKIPVAVKAWKLIPSRLLKLWDTVQESWRIEQQITPGKFANGFPDPSVFWNWEHTERQRLITSNGSKSRCELPPDGQQCRYELTESWKALRNYIESGIYSLTGDASGAFLEIHDQTFRAMTRAELPFLSRFELWPECLEPRLLAMTESERRATESLVLKVSGLLIRASVDSQKLASEEPEGNETPEIREPSHLEAKQSLPGDKPREQISLESKAIAVTTSHFKKTGKLLPIRATAKLLGCGKSTLGGNMTTLTAVRGLIQKEIDGNRIPKRGVKNSGGDVDGICHDDEPNLD